MAADSKQQMAVGHVLGARLWAVGEIRLGLALPSGPQVFCKVVPHAQQALRAMLTKALEAVSPAPLPVLTSLPQELSRGLFSLCFDIFNDRGSLLVRSTSS